MAHSFSITLSDEVSAVLGKVEAAITSNGGSFEGNEKDGIFLGKTPLGFIKGEYCFTAAREIEVTIVEKPFFVPYSVIELKIREYFT